MFPGRFRSRENYSEFIRQVAENDSPEESLDVFLTDTYLCKNCVRNRTVVQWIYTISPSGDPPGRKVLGNAIVFMHSGNHQESDQSDFAEAVFALFSYVSDTFFFGGYRMQKYYELQYFQTFHDLALGIPGSDPSDSAGAILLCFPMFLIRWNLL